jgi:hypothetical protein
MLCAMLLNDFYADPRRASSEEVDFGPSWRTNGEGPWKVLWVQATGEIVAFLESASAGFAWSGVGGGGGGGGGGNFLSETAVGFVFEPNGLGWLAERVDELSPGHAV